MTEQTSHYPIGTPGEAWGAVEKAQWLQAQRVKRSYQAEVLAKLTKLGESCELIKYGALPHKIEPSYAEHKKADAYPLFVIKSRVWQSDKPVVLITGGVHGYETSGVQGALRFAQTEIEKYQQDFNILIAPCVSPWGYETINRWNPDAVDPNRSFTADSPSPEAAQLMAYIESLAVDIYAHFDLHETTDTDNSEFRPARAARDGITQDNWNIPDGFYLVGDTEKPVPAFQKAIIEAVEKVTHIAPPDENGMIIGAPLEQKGVINYAKTKLGLCGGFSKAPFVTTTEVYPDSPQVDDENCVQAQVAAVTGGLDYLLAKESNAE
ncbi:M14 family metallocarboxypeptidase [Corallincola platygyrae]|uniref:M14 family metallocarboxypeptidase n=1 Tax=Corallincola platygyrae TaxID=1193278 RepID=A0ABW4XL20_9GAMM